MGGEKTATSEKVVASFSVPLQRTASSGTATTRNMTNSVERKERWIRQQRRNHRLALPKIRQLLQAKSRKQLLSAFDKSQTAQHLAERLVVEVQPDSELVL